MDMTWSGKNGEMQEYRRRHISQHQHISSSCSMQIIPFFHVCLASCSEGCTLRGATAPRAHARPYRPPRAGCCIARSGKLDRARSRLYRGQMLEVNMRLKALAEIYTIHSVLHLSNINFLWKNCWELDLVFAKICWRNNSEFEFTEIC